MVEQASRFVKVDIAVRAPGESFLTRNTVGPFIDTKLDVGLDGRMGFRGRVYLSIAELREMADVAGLFQEWKDIVEQCYSDLSDYESGAYHQGFQDGLKENDRDDTQLFDLLRDVADRLPRKHHADVAVVEDVQQGAGEAVRDAPIGSRLIPLGGGQVAGAGRGKRPAGVSGNPGDGASAAVQ